MSHLRLTLAAALSLGCASAATLTNSPTARTARHLASLHGEAARQSVFLREMPKGADLHSHLSGAIYAESYLRWAVEDGMCLRRAPAGIVSPPCDAAAGTAPMGDALTADGGLYNTLIDTFSMRNFAPSLASGHDHFFATFGAFDARRERSGDMLAEQVARLARQNTWYLESMQSLGVGSAGRLGRAAGWSDDLTALRARLPEADLTALADGARARVDAEERRMRELLRCGQPDEDPGCKVTVRYVVQVIRTLPREEVFAQIAAAVRVIQGDRRVVALNLVAPEDDPVARRDYGDHMRAVAHLTERGTLVPVTLHAGELTPTLVPPEDTNFHIRAAVEVAGARRIGHGTDVAWEHDAAGLLREMARRGVAVEVCPTSAAVILGVQGGEHPFALYRAAGVPMTLATDDEGVSRSDLTREYLRALHAWNLSWSDLVSLARNGLTHAFLAGDPLWRADGSLDPACAGETGDAPRGRPCTELLARSDRARAQRTFEAALRRFEARW
jgi:adenosine deaminase